MTVSDSRPLQLAPLNLVKVNNARTYRGLVTKDGQSVRDNMLVRTARLGSALPADVARLCDLGVTTVVDLRRQVEIDTSRDFIVSGVTYLNTPMFANAIAKDAPPMSVMMAYLRTHDDAKAQMQAGYRNMVATKEQQESLRTALSAAITTPGAFAWHCSMGKDRTGIMAALLLDTLGVDRQFIYTDYLYSNVENQAHMMRVVQRYADAGADERMLRNQRDFMTTQRDYLDAALDWIDTNYGGTAAYLADGLGLGETGVSALRRKFLD